LLSGSFGAAYAQGLAPWQAVAAPVRIPADVEWVSTGISVEAGQTVYLRTRGVAITAPLATYPAALSGPDGQVWNLGCGQYEGAPPPCAMDDAYYGALVGRVGPSGDPFLIGGASSFTSPADGFLYLTVNDNLGFYSDNLAGFTVLFTGE
ncbi:MAG TPA: hypothetical protein VFL17_09355, partial [Anaerolineae bacterium]|nr:hypothetical protein [Anaerolineae bacterium]